MHSGKTCGKLGIMKQNSEPSSSGKPPRYELKKYQAGYFLIALGIFLGVFGWAIASWKLAVSALIIGGTGVVFQFDKERHS
ncbi:MAG: hypothetical protein LR015_09865 [Verrucomicrobia bacterium]|nr:hypothetical protein [Verrucomicrobiota bacterium]